MTGARINDKSREDDERLLVWIDERCRGKRTKTVARRDGVSPAAVVMATSRVMRADLAESGEPEPVVRKDYWI